MKQATTTDQAEGQRDMGRQLYGEPDPIQHPLQSPGFLMRRMEFNAEVKENVRECELRERRSEDDDGYRRTVAL